MSRSFGRAFAEAHAASRQESAARRERVLRHADLARALMEPPFGIADPARWTGWIAPRHVAEVACGRACGRGQCRSAAHMALANDSPVRAQLVDIAAEALRREREGVTSVSNADRADQTMAVA